MTTPVSGAKPMDAAALERLIADFEGLYERKYGKGSAYREAGVEMTLFRLSARGQLDRPDVKPLALNGANADQAKMGRRKIFVDARDGMAEADIYDFTKLTPGDTFQGPAVIHTPITTMVVQDRQSVTVDAWRNVVIIPA